MVKIDGNTGRRRVSCELPSTFFPRLITKTKISMCPVGIEPTYAPESKTCFIQLSYGHIKTFEI